MGSQGAPGAAWDLLGPLGAQGGEFEMDSEAPWTQQDPRGNSPLAPTGAREQQPLWPRGLGPRDQGTIAPWDQGLGDNSPLGPGTREQQPLGSTGLGPRDHCPLGQGPRENSPLVPRTMEQQPLGPWDQGATTPWAQGAPVNRLRSVQYLSKQSSHNIAHKESIHGCHRVP